MSYPRFAVCLLIAVAVAAAVYAMMYTRPWESDIERAHRLCEGCGRGAGELDWLIERMEAAGGHETRDGVPGGRPDGRKHGQDRPFSLETMGHPATMAG